MTNPSAGMVDAITTHRQFESFHSRNWAKVWARYRTGNTNFIEEFTGGALTFSGTALSGVPAGVNLYNHITGGSGSRVWTQGDNGKTYVHEIASGAAVASWDGGAGQGGWLYRPGPPAGSSSSSSSSDSSSSSSSSSGGDDSSSSSLSSSSSFNSSSSSSSGDSSSSSSNSSDNSSSSSSSSDTPSSSSSSDSSGSSDSSQSSSSNSSDSSESSQSSTSSESSQSSQSSESSQSSDSSESSESSSSSGGEPVCYIPSEVEVDAASITQTALEVIAPGDVPATVTLTLQVRMDGSSGFYNYAGGIVAGERVTVSGLSSCEWYGLRWRADVQG